MVKFSKFSTKEKEKKPEQHNHQLTASAAPEMYICSTKSMLISNHKSKVYQFCLCCFLLLLSMLALSS